MLTILGFSMVVCFMYLIMTKRMSALIALILIPTIFALIGGFYAGLGEMMLDGVKKLAHRCHADLLHSLFWSDDRRRPV